MKLSVVIPTLNEAANIKGLYARPGAYSLSWRCGLAHPASVSASGISDFLVRHGIFSLRRSLEEIVQRFLEYRQLDGSLPRAHHCA